MHKKLKIGINGLGRIGRAIFRINKENEFFDIPIINEINPDNNNISYLLKYDSIYGKAQFNIESNDNELIVNGNIINVYHESDIKNVRWEDYDLDYIIDCSGQHQNLININRDQIKVKNIIITNMPDKVEHCIILGCNENNLDPKNNFIISAGICDAISGAPIFKLLNDNYKIINGSLITLHPWLGYQNLLDGNSIPFWKLHPDSNSIPKNSYHHYALGRSAPMNIIVKSTSAFKVIMKTIPELKGKIQSHSYRVPTSIVSASTIMLNLEQKTSKEDVIEIFNKVTKSQEYDIIKNSEEPLTAIDYRKENYSVVIDHRWTSVNNNTLLKIHYWYDNEWGYSCRTLDLIKEIEKKYLTQYHEN